MLGVARALDGHRGREHGGVKTAAGQHVVGNGPDQLGERSGSHLSESREPSGLVAEPVGRSR